MKVRRIMLRVVSQITLIIALISGVAIPVYILMQSAINHTRAEKGHTYIVLKALVSLVTWVLLSLLMFNMLFVTFYSAAHVEDRQAAEIGVGKSIIFLSLTYVLIGCGLAFWVRHQAKDRPKNFPKGAT